MPDEANPPVVEQPGQPAPAEQPAPTPTPAPDPLAPILAKLAALESQLKNQQRDISRKEAENKRLQSALEGREEDRNLLKAIVAVTAEQSGKSPDELTETVQTKSPDLIKKFDEITQKSEQRRLGDRIRQYQQRAISLGLTEDGERSGEYWKLYGMVARQDFDKAEQYLDNLSAPAEVKPVEPVKSPEQLAAERKKEIAEEARKMLEESGALRLNTVLPGGGVGATWTTSQIAKMPYPEYKKTFPGGWAQIHELKSQGKIKDG